MANHRGIIDVDIAVNEGEIYGFIGPNGAGKSTMIKTLLNFIYPTSGRASILGLDCTSRSREIKKKCAYVPCDVHYYEDLTVRQLMAYSASFYQGVDKEYSATLIRRFEMEADKKIGELSSGNRKKVALVAALAISPSVLILDEPTNGLDPLIRHTLFEALKEQQEKGCTVFLSSHNLDEVQALCERVAIIREGRIVDIRSLSELKARHEKKITVFALDIPDDFLAGLDYKAVSKDKGKLVFSYTGDEIKRVMAEISKLDITDLLVEDAKLAEIFMSYYE